MQWTIQNYLYLLSPLFSGMQYVGERVINVNLRMNIQRRNWQSELESTSIEILNSKKTNVIVGCIYCHPQI